MDKKKVWVALKPFIFVLLIMFACVFIRYFAFYSISYTRNKEALETHRTICQNLAGMGQIKEADCLNPSTYYEEYIPVYFPIGTTTKEIVWQGMLGVNLLDNSSNNNNSCEGNSLGSGLKYRIMLGFNVTFVFCGNQLIHIWYEN